MNISEQENKGEISDGFHTFNELYDHRNRLFITLAKLVRKRPVWVSKKHHDGTDFEGWFIMGIGDSKGSQVSYHLPIKFWAECANYFEVYEKAPYKWDGHTPEDVLKRLETWGSWV